MLGPWEPRVPRAGMVEGVAVDSMPRDPHMGTLSALKDTGTVKAAHLPAGLPPRFPLRCASGRVRAPGASDPGGGHAGRHPATSRAVG